MRLCTFLFLIFSIREDCNDIVEEMQKFETRGPLTSSTITFFVLIDLWTKMGCWADKLTINVVEFQFRLVYLIPLWYWNDNAGNSLKSILKRPL